MSIFDSLIGQVTQHTDVANMASQLGIDTGVAEKAIAALGYAHQQPGDTLQIASGKTGLDIGMLTQIVQQIGGEGSLEEFARMLESHPQAAGLLKMLDRDGDGSVIDDVADMAKGFFGKS